MNVLREHPVRLDLKGRPRWWTVQIGGRRWELVRVDQGSLYPGAPVLYLALPPGAYKWPAMAAPAAMAGPVGVSALEAKGVKVLIAPTVVDQLEQRLVARTREAA